MAEPQKDDGNFHVAPVVQISRPWRKLQQRRWRPLARPLALLAAQAGRQIVHARRRRTRQRGQVDVAKASCSGSIRSAAMDIFPIASASSRRRHRRRRRRTSSSPTAGSWRRGSDPTTSFFRISRTSSRRSNFAADGLRVVAVRLDGHAARLAGKSATRRVTRERRKKSFQLARGANRSSDICMRRDNSGRHCQRKTVQPAMTVEQLDNLILCFHSDAQTVDAKLQLSFDSDRVDVL